MGNNQSSQKINFEDMQIIMKNPESYLLINTLNEYEQHCLIKNTVSIKQEENIINQNLKIGKNIKIIVYGRNCNDETIYKKADQLTSLGFYNIYIYTGGLFEWLLLQDIYSFIEFPTTSKQLDFLKYKPPSTLNIGLLKNID